MSYSVYLISMHANTFCMYVYYTLYNLYMYSNSEFLNFEVPIYLNTIFFVLF